MDAVVRRFGEVAEYQVEIDEVSAMTEMTLKVETTPEVAQTLEKALTDAFSLRIPVQAVELGALPRFEMKARRWIRQGSE